MKGDSEHPLQDPVTERNEAEAALATMREEARQAKLRRDAARASLYVAVGFAIINGLAQKPPTSDGAIAEKFGLSPSTIRRHRLRILAEQAHNPGWRSLPERVRNPRGRPRQQPTPTDIEGETS